MHLTASVLVSRCAVFTPKVLVLCRKNIPPEFGASDSEKGRFVPGRSNAGGPAATWFAGALSIIKYLKATLGIDVVDDVCVTTPTTFTYIRDQIGTAI